MQPVQVLIIVIGGYLALGIVCIGLLELFTKRVSTRIKDYSFEVQNVTGTGNVSANAITVLLALWLFYPFAIYAALSSKRRKVIDG